ncbi:helix-turn-helix domain-containing protein [Flavobacterium sp. PLA-1-15]|uniref:helix-turn-helix domain-containing protein n=1 Tax=Flavobacterium sp. PLA-1-15 TaxID=3380533 RepID=UPI003B810EF6
MQTSLKKAMVFVVVTLILCFFLQSLAEITGASVPEVLNEREKEIHRNLTYVLYTIAAYLSFLTLYYYTELNKIENKMASVDLYVDFKQMEEENTASAKLFLNIKEYMEQKKPYINPDFTIKMLAQKLKSNPTYISRALNNEGGKKFTEFVQEYRIKQIIEDIHNNQEEYTLEELYKNAGFTNQSTFFRNFKEITGIAPSKYIENLNRKK